MEEEDLRMGKNEGKDGDRKGGKDQEIGISH